MLGCVILKFYMEGLSETGIVDHAGFYMTNSLKPSSTAVYLSNIQLPTQNAGIIKEH